MIVCQRCNKIFSNWVKIDDILHNLQNRKFCLECSPFKKHNTTDISNRPLLGPDERFCPRCRVVKTLDMFYFVRKGAYDNQCKECRIKEKVKLLKSQKIKCIEYKGGKCIVCGYNKCVESLIFHHLDPSQKDKNISRFSTVSFEKIKIELNKCILVCANCHGEIHAGLVNPNDYL